MTQSCSIRFRAQAQPEGQVVEGSEQEKEGVAAVTVGIVAPEPSPAAIESAAAAAAAADSSAVGSRPPVAQMGWAPFLWSKY